MKDGSAELSPESPFLLVMEKSWAAWRKRQPSQPKSLLPASAFRTVTDMAHGHQKDLPISRLCTMIGRNGSVFPVNETAQSWNPGSPSLQLRAPKHEPRSSKVNRKKFSGLLQRIKHLKPLSSCRYSVNIPLFAVGFCQGGSWIICSGISPSGNEVLCWVGGQGLEGWRAEGGRTVRNGV